MRKLTWSTAVKFPNRRVRPRASMATPPACDVRGGMVMARCPWRAASGSRAMNASSRPAAEVRALSSAGLPVASTCPAYMATSQANRSASSM
jgi:hypothetical protein